jgi:PAS domain S-box-containing protein
MKMNEALSAKTETREMTPLDITGIEVKRSKVVLASVPVLALLTAVISILVLIIWLTTSPAQQRQWPYFFLMKSDTALAFLILAMGLFGLWTKRYAFNLMGAACACLVVAFAAAVLTQYFVPIDLEIDQWLVADHSVDRWPGRTSVGMAISLLMIGTGYLILYSSREALTAQAILLAAVVIPVTTIGGYLYPAPDSSPFYRTSVVSLHSAICTLILCAGGLFLRPTSGLTRLLLSDSIAGSVARRLLPSAILLPAAVGAAMLYGERIGVLSNALGFAALVTSSALFFATAVWIVSAMMLRTENAKAHAESTRDAAERRLQVGEQRLRIALEAARLGTWEYLVESEELVTSAQCKAIYGLRATDPFQYSALIACIVPDQRERVQTSAEQALRASTDYKEQYEVRWPDGSFHWVLAYGRPLVDDDGITTRMVGVSLDVTESVRFRESLELADRRKDEFLATLAHELRNPLAPIRQAVKLARSEAASAAQLSWGLNVIDRQASHMAVLLDDLLDISRITRGQLTLQRDWIDIGSVMEAAMETAQPMITAKAQHVRLNASADSITVFVDPVRTAQMLSNLLINAAKYSGTGAEITLGVELEPDWLRFRVRDSGIGIASDMLSKIFEMFARVENDRARSDGGLGIGLALVRGLAELHGGNVVASSGGLGRGSEFLISLPRTATSGIPAISSTQPGTQVSRRRILIADDNQDAMETLKLLLEMDGHEIRTAPNGEAALALADQMVPEVMLLDLGMPGLSGFELAARVRERPWGNQVTIIAVTGWGQAEDRRRSFEAGFNHHLTKPIEFEGLRELLGRNAATPHATSQ